MTFQFEKAQRGEILLRVLLVGEAGHGKTYSALALAHHLGFSGDEIGVIDSECQDTRRGLVGSAEKYVGEDCACAQCQGHGIKFGEFSQLKLPPNKRDPQHYVGAIAAARNAGFKVLIADSISHEWDSCKRLVDKIKPQFGGNQWAAWSKVTPMHDEFVQTLLDFPGHVIACCRGKVKTEQKGKEITSRGLLPLQREGTEFEFDVWLNLTHQNAWVAKTRAKRLADRDFQRPGGELAAELLAWASSGSVATDRAAVDPALVALIESGLAGLKGEVKAKVESCREQWTTDAAYARATLRRLEQLRQGAPTKVDPQPVVAEAVTAPEEEPYDPSSEELGSRVEEEADDLGAPVKVAQ